MKIVISDVATDKLVTLEVEPDYQIIDIKALVEVEMQIPVNIQLLRFNNKSLNDLDRLSIYGVAENDVIVVVRKQPQQQRQQQRQQMSRTTQEQFRQMQQMQQIEADPLNPEHQRLIEEAIKKQNISHNLELAHEYMPENFGTITMLYIEITVNKHPIQAFVDSGAQSTIMSKACAERCGIMRLVDTRFKGVALGIGTQKILGRIHMIELQILDKFLACSLTILDGDGIDFLFGLDNLRRYQCSIDLKSNSLKFPSVQIEVPFLAEGQIIKNISVEQQKQLQEQQQKDKQPNSTTQQNQRPQAQNQQRQSNLDENKINSIVRMGFTRQEAIEALTITGWNEEVAGAYLTQQKYGF